MTRTVVAAMTVVLLAQCAVVRAGLREVAKGVFVDDFENGTLDGWSVQAGHVEVEKEGSNSVLELGMNSRFPELQTVTVKDQTLTDFSLEVRVRKHQWTFMNMGIVFRNGCQVVFQRRPGLLAVLTPDGIARIRTPECRELDPAWREAIQEKLAGARDLLFDDPDAVRGLEQFLSGAVSKG